MKRAITRAEEAGVIGGEEEKTLKSIEA